MFSLNLLRAHPFNLKGGWGELWVFSESNLFFRFAAQQKKKFATNCHDIIFFLQNQYFLRHKVLTEYLFLHISETYIFFQSNLPTEIFFFSKNIDPPPPLQVKWMFPNDPQPAIPVLDNCDLFKLCLKNIQCMVFFI